MKGRGRGMWDENETEVSSNRVVNKGSSPEGGG